MFARQEKNPEPTPEAAEEEGGKATHGLSPGKWLKPGPNSVPDCLIFTKARQWDGRGLQDVAISDRIGVLFCKATHSVFCLVARS